MTSATATITIRRTDWRPALRALPAGELLVAIGDVHGQAHLLEALHDAVQVDLAAARAVERATVVHIGDLTDRGTRNRDAIDLARCGPVGDDRIERIALRGNHEAMLLDVVNGTGRYGSGVWLMNGGDRVLEEIGRTAGAAAGGPAALRDAIGRERVAWLESLPLTHRVADYLLVHAGLDPARPLADQDPEDLVWIREPFLRFAGSFPEGVVVIHGHTPYGIEVRSNRVNIDTGAYFSGILTAVEIAGDRMRFVHAVGEPDTDLYRP